MPGKNDVEKAYALITGASSGLGVTFARALAKRGWNLILTARRVERMEALAIELRALGRKVEVVPGDLSQREFPAALKARCDREKWRVDLLISNAGYGSWGPMWDLDLEREMAMTELNVRAAVAMTGLFLPAMVARGTGGIIYVASTAGYQPIPYFATYSATKAFLISYSQAMAREVEEFGVRVTCLCPSGTHTEFFDVSGLSNPSMPVESFDTPESVVQAALEGWDKGKRIVNKGTLNRFMIWFARFIPRNMVSAQTKRLFRPKEVRPPVLPESDRA